MSIKEKYDRYKTSDWITLLIGVIICGFQVYKYATDNLGETAIELIAMAVWLLLIIAPKSINDIVRKARGLN